MAKSIRNLWLAGVVAAGVAVCLVVLSIRGASPDPREVLKSLAQTTPPHRLTIEYPLDETLFPPEISAPLFGWKDEDARSDVWLVSIEFPDGQGRINSVVRQPEWRPTAAVWDQIKRRSLDAPAVVTVAGLRRRTASEVLSAGHVTICTSSDPVGAPLFYREVNLPFVDAVKDPSNIRWRFGAVSSTEPPPIVLEKLPVCGNCHSFSADATVLGMDIDYANNKGSYAIAAVRQSMVLDAGTIITWSDYKRDEGNPTFGLLSQVSPDGRYVVSTVKDESVFVPKPGLDFSQLFFPVKGILCIYDRQTGEFRALPGADDPNLVQSNPTWSPDGKEIVFAATEAYKLRGAGNERKVLLGPEDCREFLVEGKPFKFDLYRIPFNEGRGGKPEPVVGASFNGRSNFFPRFSPDGKWIVFCQAENYMLLQPDSEMYIIPAEGGQPRRLRANTKRMNSWHSFSPNGKWLVFSGKPDSAYTRLYLTHIDEQGESTPPVVLDRLTAPDRAANIPEFVNASPTAIRRIREQFVDDLSYARAAWEFLKSNDYGGAERQARKALELNPQSADGHHFLGLALFGARQHEEAIRHLSEAAKLQPGAAEIQTELGVVLVARGMLDEGVRHLRKALELDPNNAEAYFNLGAVSLSQGQTQEALRCWLRAAELKPKDHEVHYNLATTLEEQGDTDRAIEYYRKAVELKPDHFETQARLGTALCVKGAVGEGLVHLSQAVALEPNDVAVRYNLAITLVRVRQYDQAITHLRQILQSDARNLDALLCLADCCVETGRLDEALLRLDEALQVAKSAGNQALAQRIARRIGQLRERRPASSDGSPQP